jgi:dipeptidyl aminopeptidase/acylaminoacyl peptidase
MNAALLQPTRTGWQFFVPELEISSKCSARDGAKPTLKDESMRKLRRFGAALLALVVCMAAADDDKRIPGTAPIPPRKLTTLDFFRHEQIGGAKVSPDGKYIAMLIPVGGLSKLGVVALADREPMAAYDVGGGEFIQNFYWVNDHMLVWETAKRDGSLGKPYLTGHLIAGRGDTPMLIPLPSPAFFVAPAVKNPDNILVQTGKSIYRLDINTKVEHEVARAPYSYQDNFLIDHSGKIRLVTSWDSDDFIVSAWDDTQRDWREIHRTKSASGYIEPIAFSSDDGRIYVSSTLEAPTNGIYETDPDLTKGKLLFRDDIVDYSDVLLEPGSEIPAGVFYYPDFPAYSFFDPNGATARNYAALQKMFPDRTVLITSSSSDGHLAVVAAWNDTHPIDYFLVELQDMHSTLLFGSRPWIDTSQMSKMSPFKLKARDGLELHGYLTLPRTSEGKNLPLVVLPHGGPAGIRDIWEFNNEVQYLAYHGYAVLQLNYRGSGGYGRDFELMGYRHWGTTMQDDLTDATRWAIQQGVADPARICIFGASYGGYSALMGVIREPDLYRCAIGYAGAYDLLLQRSDSDTADSEEGRLYLKRALGTDKEDLKARSPVYNVDRIKANVLLVHGKEDQRVPFENFKELAAALSKAGKPYESLVKPYEEHGFFVEANAVELYDRVIAFLDRNIGPGAPIAESKAAHQSTDLAPASASQTELPSKN